MRWEGTRAEGRPWVERWPDVHEHRGERTKGMVEWEDHGPIEWLGDKVREWKEGRHRGPKGYRRSDDRVQDEVCERIARSGVDADEVEVKVDKGEVTLTGSVHSRAEKWRLEEVVDDVFGVEEVHNQVRVARARGGADPGEHLPH
jgi:hypothetical protein